MSKTFRTYDEALTWADATGLKYQIVVSDDFVFVLVW